MPRKVKPKATEAAEAPPAQQRISKAELIQAAEARCWRAYVAWQFANSLGSEEYTEYLAAKKALTKLKARK